MIGKHVVIDTLDNFKAKLNLIPSSAIVLIKDVGQIYAHGTYFGAQKTYSLLTKTADGLAPKGGTSASSLIKDGETEWVLTVTNGENPSWRRLPDNAFNSLQYTLPSATTSELGGVKVGQVYTATFADLTGNYYKLNIDKNGLAYVHVPWEKYNLPTATSEILGGVKVGNSLTSITNYTAVPINNGKIYFPKFNIESPKYENAKYKISVGDNSYDVYDLFINGLGTELTSGTDLDTIKTPSIYKSNGADKSATLINAPWTSSGFRLLTLRGYYEEDTYGSQIALTSTGVFWRTLGKNNAEPSSWYYWIPFKYGENVGSSSVPVYINSIGLIKKCTSVLATNLAGGEAGGIFYQSGKDTTSILKGSSVNGYVLKYNTSTKTPYWGEDLDSKVKVKTRGITKSYLLGTTTAPKTEEQAVTSVAETGVYFDTTVATLVATTFKGNLEGNSSTTDRVNFKQLSNVDINTLIRGTNDGNFYWASTNTNNDYEPFSAYGMQVWRIASGYTGQIAFGTSGRIKTRSHSATSNTWTDWNTLAWRSDLDSYLPLKGGTMTGDITFNKGAGINSGGYAILAEVNSGSTTVGVTDISCVVIGSNGNQAVIRTSSDNLFHYNQAKSSRYLILDEFNYSQYALPLTGGTLQGSTNTPLNLKGTESDTCVAYFNSNSLHLGSIGVYSNNNPYFYHSSVNGGKMCKIWHEGNDGADSGLDADKLDGNLGSWYRDAVTYKVTLPDKWLRICKFTTTRSSILINIINTYANSDNEALLLYASTEYGSESSHDGVNCNITKLNNGILKHKTKARLVKISTSEYYLDIYHKETNNQWYISSSLASNASLISTYTEADESGQVLLELDFTKGLTSDTANKLTNTVKLWGLDFDGTADVSGNMTGVGTINGIFNINKAASGAAVFNVVESSATINYIHLYVSSTNTTAAKSRPLVLQNDYGNVGIGTISPSYKLDVNGSLGADTLKIKNTTSSPSISFSRESYNYITAPTTGFISFSLGDNTTIASQASLHINRYNLVPGTTNLVSLGTDIYRWSNVYSVLGNFSGQITSEVSDGTAPFIVSSTTLNTNLNADLLDGQHGDWYLKNCLKFLGFTPEIRDANTTTEGMLVNYNGLSLWRNVPEGMLYGSILNLKHSISNYLCGLLAWDVNHNSTTDTTRNLWWRASYHDDWIEAKWHLIAFTDSDITGNASSADKLKTPRKLWGQSFDGTKDITGSITITDGAIQLFNTSLGNDTLIGWASDDSCFLIYSYESSVGYSDLNLGYHNNAVSYGSLYLNTTTGKWGIGTKDPNYKLDVVGSLGADTLTIKNTSSAKSIAFSREGHNYIHAPENGVISFTLGSDSSLSKNASMHIYKGQINSGTTNTVSLGTSDFRWSNLYSVKGDFSDLITSSVTGKAPLIVASDTKVTNLNSDLLDGYNNTWFVNHGYSLGGSNSNSVWRKVGSCTINGSGTHDMDVVFLVNAYYDNTVGLLKLQYRKEREATVATESNTFLKWILFSKDSRINNVCMSYKIESSSKSIINLYAKTPGWFTLRFTILDSGGWTNRVDSWEMYDAGESSTTYTTIPSTETVVDALNEYSSSIAKELSETHSIWGQQFNGTQDVTGVLTLKNGITNGIESKDSNGDAVRLVNLSTSNVFYLGDTVGTKGYNTFIRGNNVNISYGTSNTVGFTLTSGGNVGIGTNAPTTKLEVNGTTKTEYLNVTKYSTLHSTLMNNADDSCRLTFGFNVASSGEEVAHIYNIKLDGSAMKPLYIGQTSGYDLVVKNNKVGIGTNDPLHKLEVNGATYLTNNNTPLFLDSPESSYSTIKFFNKEHSLNFGLNNNGLFVTNLDGWSNEYKLWHQGNDGHESGLDADLLDGYHLSSILDHVWKASHVGGTSACWGRVIEGIRTSSGTVDFSMTLLVTSYSYNKYDTNSGILQITYRSDTISTTPVVKAQWLVKNFDFSSKIKITYLYDGSALYLRVYAYSAGWDSYHFRILNKHGWSGSGGFSLTYSDVRPSSLGTFAEVPTNETVVEITNATILNSTESADKLTESVSLWGNSFDGTSDIYGSLKLNNGKGLYIKDTSGDYKEIVLLSGSNSLSIGSGAATAGYNTYLSGNTLSLRTGTSTTTRMFINSDGKIGIGNSSPSYSLDINSSLRTTGTALFCTDGGSRVGIRTTDPLLALHIVGSEMLEGNLYVKGGIFNLINSTGTLDFTISWNSDTIQLYAYEDLYYNLSLGTTKGAGGLYYDGVNNRWGIGTTAPETKLQINGDLTLKAGQTDSPRLIFLRDTSTDGWYDWDLYVAGGSMLFRVNNTGTWSDALRIRLGQIELYGNTSEAPIITPSKILCTNLNSDLLDGYEGSWYLGYVSYKMPDTAVNDWVRVCRFSNPYTSAIITINHVYNNYDNDPLILVVTLKHTPTTDVSGGTITKLNIKPNTVKTKARLVKISNSEFYLEVYTKERSNTWYVTKSNSRGNSSLIDAFTLTDNSGTVMYEADFTKGTVVDYSYLSENSNYAANAAYSEHSAYSDYALRLGDLGTSSWADANNALKENPGIYFVHTSNGSNYGGHVSGMGIRLLRWGYTSGTACGAGLQTLDIYSTYNQSGVYIRQGKGNGTDMEYLEWGKIATTTDLNSYLPLAGGTIEGTYGALDIKRNNANFSGIKFSNNNGTLGYIGVEPSSGRPTFLDSSSNSYTLAYKSDIPNIIYSWSCSVAINTWSRLCFVKQANTTVGCKFLLNIAGTRNSVVFNDLYAITAHHYSSGCIVKLAGSEYSTGYLIRIIVNSTGACYVEMYDNLANVDSVTRQTVYCRLVAIYTGDVTKYESYTSGTTIPSGYSVKQTLTQNLNNLQGSIDASSVDGYSISVGNAGTDTSTIYFVT